MDSKEIVATSQVQERNRGRLEKDAKSDVWSALSLALLSHGLHPELKVGTLFQPKLIPSPTAALWLSVWPYFQNCLYRPTGPWSYWWYIRAFSQYLNIGEKWRMADDLSPSFCCCHFFICLISPPSNVLTWNGPEPLKIKWPRQGFPLFLGHATWWRRSSQRVGASRIQYPQTLDLDGGIFGFPLERNAPFKLWMVLSDGRARYHDAPTNFKVEREKTPIAVGQLQSRGVAWLVTKLL